MAGESDRSVMDLFTSRQVKALDDAELQELLLWIDKIPISREKRNLPRDMSDGVPIAEIIKHFLPRLVEIHQYIPSNGTQAKEKNWFHMNRRIFSKLGFELHADVVHGLAQSKPWYIENLLILLRERLDQALRASSFNQASGIAVHTMSNRSDRANGENGMQVNLSRSDAIQQSVLDQQRKQINEQNKTIDVLTANILKLEHVIHLKDIRIQDLSSRLQKAGLKVFPEETDKLPLSSRNAVVGKSFRD